MTSQISDITSSSTQVQGTNDNSIVSKLSMVTQGYLEDKYLKFFVQKPQRRSPIINRGYYIRSKAIRHVLIKYLTARKGRPVQIVSLGAGFDTTYFIVRDLIGKNKEKHLKYLEIDYPPVISRKVKLAQAAQLLPEQGQQTDKNVIYRNENYCAVGFDLRRVGSELTHSLQNCGLNLKIPTLFLSEVVLTYLTSCQSRNIIKWINHSFCNAVLVVFEQMLPSNGFGEVMLRHFEACGSPLLAIKDHPTLSSHMKRHHDLGFKVVIGADMLSFYQHIVSSEEKEKIKNIETFDEFEAWHQTCLHYFIMCSTNSEEESVQEFCNTCLPCQKPELWSLLKTLYLLKAEKLKPKGIPEEVTAECNKTFSSIQMFGHCASEVTINNKDLENQIITFGGFGLSTQTQQKKAHHRRLLDVTLLDVSNKKHTSYTPNNVQIKAQMYCSIVQKPNDEAIQQFLLFGGRSSPKRASNNLNLITITENHLEHNIKLIPTPGTCPSGRWRHTANILHCVKNNKDKGHQMLIFGGRDEHKVLGDCWSLNMHTFIWCNVVLQLCEENIVLERHSHSAVACSRKNEDLLIISGGLDCNEEPLNDVITLKMRTDSKAVIDRLDVQPQLPPLYSHTSHVHKDRYLILVGGIQLPKPKELHENSNSLSDQVIIIDLTTNTWIRTLTLKSSPNCNPVMLYGHRSFIFCDNGKNDVVKIFIIGGGCNCFSFGTSLNKSPFMFSIDF